VSFRARSRFPSFPSPRPLPYFFRQLELITYFLIWFFRLHVGFADAAIAPIDFPIAPTVAIPLALKNAGLTIEDISLFEINEAFSVVVKAAEKVLGLDPAKINVSGFPSSSFATSLEKEGDAS